MAVPWAAALLSANPDLSVTATDLDPVMLAAARRRLATFGPMAAVLAADARSLPFPDGSFDTAASFLMRITPSTHAQF